MRRPRRVIPHVHAQLAERRLHDVLGQGTAHHVGRVRKEICMEKGQEIDPSAQAEYDTVRPHELKVVNQPTVALLYRIIRRSGWRDGLAQQRHHRGGLERELLAGRAHWTGQELRKDASTVKPGAWPWGNGLAAPIQVEF